jgi:Fur family transcriptional regulator, ferric uptake regulator
MVDKFKHYLKAQGHSVTAPRLAVFRYLQANDPAGLSSIIADTQGVDRASIYRTLTLFRGLHIIQDIITGGQKMIELADGFDSHHHHISCMQCGTSVTVEDEAIEQRLQELALAKGIVPQTHQIEVSGICRACAKLA